MAKDEDGEYYKVPGDMSYEQWYNYVNNPAADSPFGKAARETIQGVKPGEPTNLGSIDFEDKELVHKTLRHFEEQFKDSSIEHNISITADGDVWYVRGTQGQVNPTKIIEQGVSLEGSYSFHNHPVGESRYSFSREDIEFFLTYKEAFARASDEKYWYEMRRRADTVVLELEGIGVDYAKARIEAVENIRRNALDIDLDEFHETVKILSEVFKFGYKRGLK